jgi:Fe-S oxidoreductase
MVIGPEAEIRVERARIDDLAGIHDGLGIRVGTHGGACPGACQFSAPVAGPRFRVAGFAPQRLPPRFAAESFQHWFSKRRHARAEDTRPAVVLWPDTFNNYFLPGTAKAAVAVLEDAGYRVAVPTQPLCCGRPLYDYGMLDLAKRKLRQVIAALRPAIRSGVPIVGLEPSCASVFRDELLSLMPDDDDARRLADQTMLLSKLLMKNHVVGR